MHNQRKKSDESCWSPTAQVKKYIFYFTFKFRPWTEIVIFLNKFTTLSLLLCNANVDHELPFVTNCWSLIRTCSTLSNSSSLFFQTFIFHFFKFLKPNILTKILSCLPCDIYQQHLIKRNHFCSNLYKFQWPWIIKYVY